MRNPRSESRTGTSLYHFNFRIITSLARSDSKYYLSLPIAVSLSASLFTAKISKQRTTTSINTIIGNSKRFMAYEIVMRLQEKVDNELLTKLAEGVSIRDYKRDKLHEVFKPSLDWKECRSSRFFNQKLNYIQDNPCRGKWNLVASPVDYVHSSAKFYLTEDYGIYEVLHCGMLEDIDLTGLVSE